MASTSATVQTLAVVEHLGHPIENGGDRQLVLDSFEDSSLDTAQPESSIASSDLTLKILGDVVVGSSVTFCVAPFLTVVDKAIVQSTAGSHTMLQSSYESIAGIISQPRNYFKSPTFLLMWGVYAATYSSANTLKTLVEHEESRSSMESTRKQTHAGKLGVFLGTTVVNSGTSLMKDQAYAKMFGTNSTSAIVPRMSYALWIMRDLSVIGSSFILPDVVSGHVAKAYDMDEESARSMSQLVLPIAAQTVAGPLHFLGLDLYNRNLSSKSWVDAMASRAKFLYNGYTSVVAARIARIAPGYGFGGVMNTKMRNHWRNHLLNRSTLKTT